MITWISRRLWPCLAVVSAAGCDEAATGAFFAAPRTPPVIEADMMDGGLTLVAPPGFCIDRANLAAQFALIARCDTLGAAAGAAIAPIAVISVSVAVRGEAGGLPTAGDLTNVHRLSAPRDAQQTDNQILFRAEGPTPVDGMSDTHWRAAAEIGSYVLGLALFGPDDGPAISDDGAGILKDLIARTRRKTGAD